MAARPPLALSVVSIAPGGQETIWWSGSPRPWERPQNISFKTRRGEGFSEAILTLSRDISYDWIDLGMLNEIVIVGDDGQVKYEGQITGSPRTWESAGQQYFTVSCVGHMIHAQDRPFSERYVDCRLSEWAPMSVQRRVNLLTAGAAQVHADGQVAPDTTTNAPSLQEALEGPWAANSYAEAWYDAGVGAAIGSVYFAWKRSAMINSADANYSWALVLATDDIGSVSDTTGSLRAAGPGTGTVTATATNRRFALAQLFYALANGNAGSYPLFWTCLAVYSNHGLTKRTTGDATNAPALWLSDILKNIAQRFCPKLSTAGVQENQTLIYQSAYDDSTAFAAWQELNSFALWELGVWENKTLTYEPADLTDYDWEIRLGEPGVSTTLQGLDANDLRNGIVVIYEDSITGKRIRLYPDQFAELRDDSPDNPANLWGRQKWGEPFEVPVPCNQAMALSFGRAKLAELNTPKEIGQVTVTGHVRDRAGHWRPVNDMRAGQTVAITNFPNSRPRIIGETSYDDDARRMDIATDGPFQTLEAYFDRLASRRTARNF